MPIFSVITVNDVVFPNFLISSKFYRFGIKLQKSTECACSHQRVLHNVCKIILLLEDVVLCCAFLHLDKRKVAIRPSF